MKYSVWLWPALAALYAVAIFIGSAIPAPELPDVVTSISDKVLHVSEYAVFGYLLHRAFLHQTRFAFVSTRAALFAILIGLLYGASDEIHQVFVPGRVADVMDWFADSFGAILGVVISRFLLGMAKRRRHLLLDK